MKAVVAAFNQEKALVGAFSVITNLWIDLRLNLYSPVVGCLCHAGAVVAGRQFAEIDNFHPQGSARLQSSHIRFMFVLWKGLLATVNIY